MYRLHDSIIKLWIMYEGAEKIKKYEIRLFVTETTKNLMNLMAFELVTYGHTSSHIVTISLPLVRLRTLEAGIYGIMSSHISAGKARH